MDDLMQIILIAIVAFMLLGCSCSCKGMKKETFSIKEDDQCLPDNKFKLDYSDEVRNGSLQGNCNSGLACACKYRECNKDYLWQCIKDTNRKEYEPCIPGQNQCEEELFCSSKNDKYIYNNNYFNRCMKKTQVGNYDDYCNPSFEEGIQNSEKSCMTGSCKKAKMGKYYKCMRN